MIRTPPQHNTTNPPGQIVNPVKQGKTLEKEIEEYQDSIYAKGDKEGRLDYAAGYRQGYLDGYKKSLHPIPQLAYNTSGNPK